MVIINSAKQILCKCLEIVKRDGFMLFVYKVIRYGYFKIKHKLYVNLRLIKKYNAEKEQFPLVSIIVVNYNGNSDYLSFLDSIAIQSYRRFELVIVDNNSTDESLSKIIERCAVLGINVCPIECNENNGFAEGCNIGVDGSQGDYLALVNMDTKLDVNWLSELVKACNEDERIAASTSKTLFWDQFCSIKINSPGNLIKIDKSKLISSLSYDKIFVKSGVDFGQFIQSESGSIELWLPKNLNEYVLEISSECDPVDICVTNENRNIAKLNLVTKTQLITIKPGQIISYFNVVNNAGSGLAKNGMPYDIGFGKKDEPTHDSPAYLDAFCGCSVLIKRRALIGRKLFVSEFFAYYEDSELSRYMKANDYLIKYVPRSILYHKHSATSKEGSPLWNYLVARSQKLYNFTKSDSVETLEAELNKLASSYKDHIPHAVYRKIQGYNYAITSRLRKSGQLYESRKTLGVYNEYWNTYGGGEGHCLSIVKDILERNCIDDVFFISQTNFDLGMLLQYFSMDLKLTPHKLLTKINVCETRKFDIFINSTYLSNLKSDARLSYYIVSFPQRFVSPRFLTSYNFLYNSVFTKKWCEAYWGKNLKGQIVYPVGTIRNTNSFNSDIKNKLLLCVGRYFVGSHCKNQDIVLDAVVKSNYLKNKYKMNFVGSLSSNSNDIAYFEKLKKNSNQNIAIHANVGYEELQNFYKISLILISGTGIGVDAQNAPEKLEHFGMSVLEGLLYGCIPVVHNTGGPAELLKKIGVGYTYNSASELISILNNLMELGEDSLNLIAQDCFLKAKNFVIENQIHVR